MPFAGLTSAENWETLSTYLIACRAGSWIQRALFLGNILAVKKEKKDDLTNHGAEILLSP